MSLTEGSLTGLINAAATTGNGDSIMEHQGSSWSSIRALYPDWYLQRVGDYYLACKGSHRFFLNGLRDLRTALENTMALDTSEHHRFEVVQLTPEESIHVVRTGGQACLCGLSFPMRPLVADDNDADGGPLCSICDQQLHSLVGMERIDALQALTYWDARVSTTLSSRTVPILRKIQVGSDIGVQLDTQKRPDLRRLEMLHLTAPPGDCWMRWMFRPDATMAQRDAILRVSFSTPMLCKFDLVFDLFADLDFVQLIVERRALHLWQTTAFSAIMLTDVPTAGISEWIIAAPYLMESFHWEYVDDSV
jgi:hypothetical protein